MKSLILFVALLFAVTLATTPTVTTKASSEHKKQQAVMQFNDPVRLMGVMLKGEYLFVHDEEAMMRGEACTFVYQGSAARANKLVVSFRCTPAERLKVGAFTVRTINAAGVNELREYQFGGQTESHLVPVN